MVPFQICRVAGRRASRSRESVSSSSKSTCVVRSGNPVGNMAAGSSGGHSQCSDRVGPTVVQQKFIDKYHRYVNRLI